MLETRGWTKKRRPTRSEKLRGKKPPKLDRGARHTRAKYEKQVLSFRVYLRKLLAPPCDATTAYNLS